MSSATPLSGLKAPAKRAVSRAVRLARSSNPVHLVLRSALLRYAVG